VRRQHPISSTITLPYLLSILLILNGCYATLPPSGIHFPITSGSHTLLPGERQRILVRGDPLLAHLAEEWLRFHHYSDILMHPQMSYPSSDHHAAFAAAAKANADLVLVLEREELKDGALIQSNCGALFHITVDVRGLQLHNQETVLQGSAHYPHCVERNDRTIQNLTCQALATAWGFRASGQLEIPSHLTCTAGQNSPAPTR
jgi:hypothetical protein